MVLLRRGWGPLLGFFVSLIKGFRNGFRRGLLAFKGKHQGRQAMDFGSHQEELGRGVRKETQGSVFVMVVSMESHGSRQLHGKSNATLEKA